MNCKDYQHQITLFLYEELPEKARPILESHLLECTACQGVFEAEKTMHSVMAEDAVQWEVPSDLLVESRRSLSEELDRFEQKRAWWRMPVLSALLTPMRLLESGALVAMGLALGVYVSNQRVQSTPQTASVQDSQISVIPRNASVSNLRIVNSDPTTGQVELAGEVSQPMRFQGRMDDLATRNLLFGALRDVNNPGSRLNAVKVLSQKPTDETVEEALINALIYDENLGVRLSALEALKQYAGEQHVRAALTLALLNDQEVGIRIGAIDALTKTKGNRNDTELTKTIREVGEKDDNAYVKNKALQYVGAER